MTGQDRGGLAQRTALWLALALPAALLGGAYVSQYGFGLYPCEMCWWQRWPHFAALALALLALLSPAGSPWRRLLIAAAAGGIATSGAIGAFHAGVEYGWWEGITACAVRTPATPGVSALDAVLNTPLVRCDVAPWRFIGISLAGWNAILSILGALAIFLLLAARDAKEGR